VAAQEGRADRRARAARAVGDPLAVGLCEAGRETEEGDVCGGERERSGGRGQEVRTKLDRLQNTPQRQATRMHHLQEAAAAT